MDPEQNLNKAQYKSKVETSLPVWQKPASQKQVFLGKHVTQKCLRQRVS